MNQDSAALDASWHHCALSRLAAATALATGAELLVLLAPGASSSTCGSRALASRRARGSKNDWRHSFACGSSTDEAYEYPNMKARLMHTHSSAHVAIVTRRSPLLFLLFFRTVTPAPWRLWPLGVRLAGGSSAADEECRPVKEGLAQWGCWGGV